MFMPRIKFVHQPVRHGDGRIRIGGIVRGIDAVIPDPDGSVWALLTSLDGTRTVDQAIDFVVRSFPHRTPAEVEVAVETLVQAGYVENVAERLTEDEICRYEPARALWQWMDRTPRSTSWDAQLKLRQARVVVVGIGGAGCTAALALTISGVGHVHCVEPDVVELSNLGRQVLFTERDVGRPKLDVALEQLRARNSHVRVTGERRTIDGPAALKALAVTADVLVLTADQPAEIRSWTNAACLETGTAWVHGGYHGPLVSFGLYRPGKGPCYECGYADERARQAELPPRLPWPPAAGMTRPNAVNAVTAGIAGHLTAHAAMSLLTGVPSVRTNCQYGLNLVTLRDIETAGPEKPSRHCRFCSP